jgi:hypothetical protein
MTLAKRSLLKPGIVLLTASVVGLAGLQYLMPASFDNPPGVNHAGIDHFLSVIPMVHVPALSISRFSWMFRVLLATAWIGYGMILVSGYRYSDLE